MADKIYMLKNTWQGILNALRAKTGTANTYVAGQVAAAITGIPNGYDIGKNAATTSELTFEDGTEVVGDPFTTIPSVVLPSTATEIKDKTFFANKSLTSINLNEINSLKIGNNAFSGCSALAIDELAIPGNPTFGDMAFFNVSIRKINQPKSGGGDRSFKTKGTEETILGYTATQICYGSETQTATVKLGSIIYQRAFGLCPNLTTVDLEKATEIRDQAFYSDTLLTTLILRSPTLCTLATIGAFTNSPFDRLQTSLPLPTLVVPANLVSVYRTATNWSSLRCNIVALEGSEWE